MVSPAPGWYADPYRRHEYRYWNGQTWSEHVGDHGQTFVDPPGERPPQAASMPAPTAAQPGGPVPTYAAPWAAPAATAQAAPKRRATPILLAGVVVVALVAGGVGLFIVNSSKPSQLLTGTALSTTATTLKGAGGLQLDIPASAVPPDRNGKPATIVVSVNKAAAPTDVDTSNLPNSVKMSGDVFQIEPEGQTFTTPVTLTLPIPQDQQANAMGGLAYLDVETHKWIAVPGEVDAAAGVVRAQITHFSLFGDWFTDQAFQQYANWQAASGGWFDVTNHGMGVGGGPPYQFLGVRAPRYHTFSTWYGFCITATTVTNTSWYVGNDATFLQIVDPTARDSGPRSYPYWLPNGTYSVDEVWGGSEINEGHDPEYVPITFDASRPLGNLVVTAGSHRAFDDSTVKLDAADGWVPGRPSCFAKVIPSLGSGDVQVTLNWPQTGVDLDLHVVDPSGNEIYYGNPSSPTGGQLDWDNRNGGGTPENIFWTGGGAPKGTYKVSVVYYGGDKPADWSIRTVVNGKVQTFSGHISESSPTVQVTTFTVG